MKTLNVVAGLLLCASAGQVAAQDLNASETSTSINTQNHSTTVVFTPGMTATNSFDFQLNYNPALLTFDSVTTNNADIGCSSPMAGQVLCFADAGSTGLNLDPIPSSTITVLFDTGAMTGTAVLDIANVNMASTTGASQTPTVDDGEVVINLGPQAEFDAVPAPPGPIVINGAVGVDGTSTINVNNDLGDVGSTLTLSAVAADTGTGTLSVTPANASVAQGAPDAVFTVTCSAPAAENFTGTVTFTTNDGDDMEGTVVYNVNCNIAATPAPEFNSVPVAGSTIIINDAVGGGGTTDTVVVSNTGNANLLTTASGLSGVLAVTPTGQQTTAPMGQTTFTITCTATSGGAAPDQTLTLTTNDSDEGTNTYTVRCVGVAPEYNSVPTAGSTITIVDAAGDGMGTTGTLTVSNTGTGDLLVGAPSGLSGILSIAPNSAQTIAPGASVVYTITCNAVDAVNVTQTLTLTSNDADEATNAYTVVCDATGAEISTTPPSGATINFQGFPGSVVNGSVSVTNSGDAVLNITGCMLGGANPGSFTAPAGTTVAAGGTGTLAFTCTAPAPGTTLTATVTCTTNDASEPTITYNLSCTGLNPSIPTLSDYGKLIMVVLVLGLGLLGFGLRRTA